MELINERTKEVVMAVTGQVCAMLENNVLRENGTEGFEGWCEDGDTFFHMEGKDGNPVSEEFYMACVALMHQIAPLVDQLTYLHLNLGY